MTRLASISLIWDLGIWGFGDFHEGAEDAEARVRRLLGMKLHAEHAGPRSTADANLAPCSVVATAARVIGAA